MTIDEVIFFVSKLAKKISLDKHFCFRFGTIMSIFLFIDVKRWKDMADSKKAKRSSKEVIKNNYYI